VAKTSNIVEGAFFIYAILLGAPRSCTLTF